MKERILDSLVTQALISEEQSQRILRYENQKLFSLNWELRTLLYLGISLLSAGLGIFVYKHIDTIGHQVIILIIAVLSAGCFHYSFRKNPPFTKGKVINSNPFADYIVLLGCLLFLTLEGYLQYQYSIFGERYGIAALLPAVFFFFIAYRFDHKGVLSLAITALASFVGITLSPLSVFENTFNEETLIFKGLGLGVFILIAAILLTRRNVKKHFSFTYNNFAAQLLFLSTISGLMLMNINFVFIILLAVLCVFFIVYSRKESSFYFLLISVIYGYWGLTYIITRFDIFNEFSLLLAYFFVSCVLVILFFLNYKKILKIK